MGKNQQISLWFDLYSDVIYQFFLYRIGSSDVEDLVQVVFIQAIKSYDSFNEAASPKTWLYSIARHLAIDEIRGKKLDTFYFTQRTAKRVSYEKET
ncbi:RNA polymerase sigma factor [Paenisporosarcina sp. OV554]|uniref:RNA polymerase sigma factor n=1 Tax=Paenisporosarcina sp. OV554 TaxID=2135694 RepID=UPI000D3465AE|nr:RNA polymerase sigma factor [Paenisporosarcina sp. OV554]PUB16677.1 RNA polymerase sigma factor (sigma-70 family) [Paenisporosarcina sp. OV554]